MPNPNDETAPHFEMLRLAMGHGISQACAVAARLGIADRLGKGARTSDDLTSEVGADARALYRLLRCCASVGVFAKLPGSRFALTPLEETLRSNAPDSLRDLLIAETAPGHWLPWGR